MICNGKSLAWDEDGKMALAEAVQISADSVVGSQQLRAKPERISRHLELYL